MSAYMVFTLEEVLDEAALKMYTDNVRPTFARHTFELLAAYGAEEVLEGRQTNGTVIVKFPTMEAAKAWYDSPEYRVVREHRFRGARYHAVLIQGVD